MAHFSPNDFKFYGLTTAGERGQIVIPKEVRAAMKISPRDKFFVFAHDDEIIAMIKPEKFNSLIKEMTGVLKKIKRIKAGGQNKKD
ncbi:AbrB/MazE/SpoVT family DNA-binding domain-containing protein [Candidatus Falkowbacteria bacterium]|nr:AbrB/MazE/SpoVT family DNA-binding domain-containing protein [Candidatus Falkowbacteria bacterium]